MAELAELPLHQERKTIQIRSARHATKRPLFDLLETFGAKLLQRPASLCRDLRKHDQQVSDLFIEVFPLGAAFRYFDERTRHFASFLPHFEADCWQVFHAPLSSRELKNLYFGSLHGN